MFGVLEFKSKEKMEPSTFSYTSVVCEIWDGGCVI